MITVFGEGRGFRVVWLLEEMGLAYRLRPVDLLAGVENDPEFLAINPAGFIPAIQDGDVTMVESIAIMEYLMARHGPTPLAPEPHDPAFPAYQQFLHLGEAGLAASIYFVVGRPQFRARGRARELERRSGAGRVRDPAGAGDAPARALALYGRRRFTAADISVTYALELAGRNVASRSARPSRPIWRAPPAREGYKRTMAACHATRAWAETVAARAATTE